MTRFATHSLAALAALFITVIGIHQVVTVPAAAASPTAHHLA